MQLLLLILALVASERPLLVVVDDALSLDPMSWRLVRLISEQARSARAARLSGAKCV